MVIATIFATRIRQSKTQSSKWSPNALGYTPILTSLYPTSLLPAHQIHAGFTLRANYCPDWFQVSSYFIQNCRSMLIICFLLYSPSYVHGFFQVQRRLNLENVELTISIRNLDLFACRIVFMNQNQLCSVYKLKSIQGFGTCKPKDEDNSLRPCRLRSCKLP